MVILGADTHKSTHTIVAIDEVGRPLAETTVEATPAGHRTVVSWARQFSDRRWALEDVRHLSRRLEADLLRAGEHVVRVPTRLMGQAQRSGRVRGKSDPIDALATARAALREPDLPEAFLDGEERELRLLVDHREDYVSERTRMENRFLWDLHELFPGRSVAPRSLSRKKTLDALTALLATAHGLVAELARERLARVRELTGRIKELEREIIRRTAQAAPSLMALAGCGALTTAKLIGETARASRFHSRAAYARANGTAPIPVSSGRNDRYRLNRGGNRQINCALHRIAITQMRIEGPGRTYFTHRLSRRCGDVSPTRCSDVSSRTSRRDLRQNRIAFRSPLDIGDSHALCPPFSQSFNRKNRRRRAPTGGCLWAGHRSDAPHAGSRRAR